MMPTTPWMYPEDRWRGCWFAILFTVVFGSGIAVLPPDPLGLFLLRLVFGVIVVSWVLAGVMYVLASKILKNQGQRLS